MKTSTDRFMRDRWVRVAATALVAVAVALSAGCSSSRGKGKIAKEIQNLPNGLVADTKDADHTDQTLQNDTNPTAGE
jgi:hypothetical protein